ncbi:nitroreductase family protein [Faecalispora anaeroviscerum]|uniref:nitroreductase family protein n=1 Tax=Faecalispora anaeroviscerum TaxID=2991836 RepID=UPI0024BB3E31|nr:nitroreductase family protein [Faecalispora anaeroviscerum]
MALLHVNKEKCVHCEICAQVCPKNYIEMNEEKFPVDAGHTCISCGHCVAICPQGALNHVQAPISEQVLFDTPTVLDTETAESFLRSRRSVRVYKEDKITKAQILKLLDIARLAPSGNNTQGVQYMVVNNKKTLCAITKATIAWMDEAIAAKEVFAANLIEMSEHYHKTGEDVILRNAPSLILALSDKNFARGRDNTHFALAYAELFATSMGLGTCWTGLVETCARSGYQPLLELLDIPDNLMVTGGIIVGYPKYRFRRLVNRSPLIVTWHPSCDSDEI